jgi:uncharacterized protein
VNCKNLLGLLLKFPEPGRVKTRLAKDIGPAAAADFCRRIAEHVLQMTAPEGSCYKRIIFYTPGNLSTEFGKWLSGEKLKAQKGDDIGERMHNALEEMLFLGAGKAIVIGADIPELDRNIIVRAFQALDAADVVLGPAVDGGYYLIGLKTSHRELFSGISWSTGKVFEQTVSRIEKKRLVYRLVDTLFDVDRVEDLPGAEEIIKAGNQDQ